MTTIAGLEARLTKLYDEHSNADLEIETTSMALIAALLREAVPTATHLLLDWGDQGPHHDLADVTAADGMSLMEQVEERAEDVAVYVTNLRGAIADRFEPINPEGGVYRVELARF
ncbi:hypothetical protein HCA61_22305 [Rhodococcus sp. HNM0563]|uniref:hypothetical protein n=1 Tax=Rhodococcus sp. HNM0563 TaxID=2716339 RepID=UPI00146C2B5D|nr:hypothetical protein [Rhodococcus sp. HNM0563]NLU64972.1 hypothetical protein [Rhodococcus sp. HNM0563]